ncbi:DUF6124 family protein [Pseudomonas sp. GL-B-19]|uniref:DUF6124 family protein n=1 Tax=Pseudomonas sp. GL-B-19 TaxID=2832393 RepID=UPI001CBFB95F|nr:DUF6124 family protein [Pseudomonas sp. GL-B-19]
MKKLSKPQQPQTPTDADHPAPAKVCETAKVAVTQRPRRVSSPQQIFAIAPGVDTLTLLKQACETLASLNALLENFAAKLEGPNRGEVFSIQQLAMVAELLVTQVRDNLASRDDASAGQPVTRH